MTDTLINLFIIHTALAAARLWGHCPLVDIQAYYRINPKAVDPIDDRSNLITDQSEMDPIQNRFNPKYVDPMMVQSNSKMTKV